MKPKRQSVVLGERYGVSAKVIATIGVSRFEAMTEAARLVMLSASALTKQRQRDGVPESSSKRKMARQRLIRKASQRVGSPLSWRSGWGSASVSVSVERVA